MFQLKSFVFSLVLILGLSGCVGGTVDDDAKSDKAQDAPDRPALSTVGVSIEAPQDGVVTAASEIEVRGTAPTEQDVVINGETIEVVDGEFTHTVSLDREGHVAVEVSAAGAAETRTVVVDRSGPTLTVTHPMRGSFQDRSAGDTIEVSGMVTDPAGVRSLTINGQAVSFSGDGQFSTTLQAQTGTNVIQIEAVDANGAVSQDARAVIFGDFTPFETPVDDAITLRLEGDALTLAAEALGQGITPDLFGNLGGAVPEGAFQILGVTMGETEVKLHPGNGILGIELRVYDLRLDFSAEFEGTALRGDIDADPAVIRLDMRLDTDGIGGLDLQIVNATADMEDFDFDVSGLLGLFDWVIRGIVRNELEKGLADALRGKIVADILDADALNQTGELLGHPAEYALSLTHIAVDPGGIDVTLDSGITVDGNAARTLPGYFSNHARAPHGSGDSMVRFSLADDFINMLLAQVWQVGGLKVDLAALLNSSEESAIPLQLNAASVSALLGAGALLDYVGPEAEIGLMLETHAPPLIQATAGAEPKVQIDVPELQLTFSVEIDGVSRVWAVVVVHLGIGLTRDAADELLFDVSTVIDVVEAPLFPLSEEDVAGPLTALFGLLPGLVTNGGGEGGGLLGGLANLGGMDTMNPGLRVENFSMRIGGQDGGYLNFGLDLGVQLLPEDAPELAIIQTEVSPINGRTYHLLEPSSWSDAEAVARTLGGHLATIRSREENRWVLRTFGEIDRQNRDLWIGLHDGRREGQMEWASGEPVTYTNFDRKQPDNGVEERTGGLNEDYVHIYGDRSERRDGFWNDGKDVTRAEYSAGFYGVVEVFEDPQAEEPPSDDPESE